MVPQVVKDMTPMMWVRLEVREQVGSRSFRLVSRLGMEAFSSVTVILLGKHWTVATPADQFPEH